MDEMILERALKALEALNTKDVVPAPIVASKSKRQQGWPEESLDALRRFAQPHAKLFPFIGRKVRTPQGTGTLIQVFASKVAVVLESELERCSFFQSDDVEPVSWEIS